MASKKSCTCMDLTEEKENLLHTEEEKLLDQENYELQPSMSKQSKKVCKKCMELSTHLQKAEKKMKDAEELLQQRNEKRIKLQTKLDDYQALSEQEEEEREKLNKLVKAAASENTSTLSTLAQLKIHNLDEKIEKMEDEADEWIDEFEKRKNQHEQQTSKAKTLISELEFVREKAKEQKEAQKNFKRNCNAKVHELHHTRNEQMEEIQELRDALIHSLEIMEKVVNTREFGNDQLREKLQRTLTNIELNDNENL